MAELSLQAQIPHNHCFGCGPENAAGLNLESYWTGEGPSVARFVPQPQHCAAPSHFVNGGIIATLIDCHCICTATADAYRLANRSIGSTPELFFATAKMSVEYLRPSPIQGPLKLYAEIDSRLSNGCIVGCTLEAQGKVRVRAAVTAVQVDEAWMTQQQQ